MPLSESSSRSSEKEKVAEKGIHACKSSLFEPEKQESDLFLQSSCFINEDLVYKEKEDVVF